MGAFENETATGGKQGKSIKRMISQCTSLVNKTRQLSKFANESLAKVEKVRRAIESKKLQAQTDKLIKDTEAVKNKKSQSKTNVKNGN